MNAVSNLSAAHLRVARPTDDLAAVVAFYRDGLGFDVLAEFADHDGFDGVMLGRKGAAYHLEFTRKAGHAVGRAPTEDNLLVFYLPEAAEWTAAVAWLEKAGHQPVPAFNPYWDCHGNTFEDPDGYRVVLQHAAWGTAQASDDNATPAVVSTFPAGTPEGDPRRRLSSKVTVFYKFIFPVLWFTFCTIATVSVWLDTARGRGGDEMPTVVKWMPLGMLVVGTVFLLWFTAGLKKVRIDSQFLYVSNYLREIQVPISEIAEVTENLWMNHHPIRIHFRTPTEFGTTVTFAPTPPCYWMSHPVVKQLQRAAGLPVKSEL